MSPFIMSLISIPYAKNASLAWNTMRTISWKTPEILQTLFLALKQMINSDIDITWLDLF